MKRTKKMMKVAQRILGALVIMSLCMGASSLDVSAAENVDTEDMAEIYLYQTEDDEKVEVLEAQLIDVEEGSEIVPYTMMTQCTIAVSKGSDGMKIDISTCSVGTSSVIGVKNIKVQKKNWLGLWTTVATCSGAEVYNSSSFGMTTTYTGAEEGATYRILCTHYANVDGYTEGDNDSGSFKYNF